MTEGAYVYTDAIDNGRTFQANYQFQFCHKVHIDSITSLRIQDAGEFYRNRKLFVRRRPEHIIYSTYICISLKKQLVSSIIHYS